MKCIHCSVDNKYPERVASRQRCKGCGHPFAFEPKTDPFQMNDPLFARTIKDVSADGTLAFTPRQLWYEVNRRLLARKTFSCGAGVLALILGGSLLAQARHHAPLVLGLPCLAVGATVVNRSAKGKDKKKPTRYPKMSLLQFDAYLSKWVSTHGAIPKLLVPPHKQPQTIRESSEPRFDLAGNPVQFGQNAAPDVTAYSFDRALITESAEIAAMLVANNFHFENNCAILSLDGYPFGMAETIKTMLARNPALKVFALHDATIRGSQMGLTLRRPEWFPEKVIPLIDLGLRPRHVFAGGIIALATTPQKFPVGTVSTSLGADEIAWLEAGNSAELHAIRPHKLMRAVYQGFARAGETSNAEVGADGFIIVDTGPSYWMYDGGADVYAADSFG